jgi:hypothetical protein
MEDGHAAFNLACQRAGLGCFWPETAFNHCQDSQAHRATLDFSSDPPFPLNAMTHLRSQDYNKASQMLSTAASALDWEKAGRWAARHHAQVTNTELAIVKSFMTKHISKLSSDATLGVASMVAAATEAIEDPVLHNVNEQEEHHVAYPLQGVKFRFVVLSQCLLTKTFMHGSDCVIRDLWIMDARVPDHFRCKVIVVGGMQVLRCCTW